MNRLQGKTAWISGATSGIGAATAELFAAEGANVIIAGRRIDKANSLVEKINKNYGSAIAFKCDVTKEKMVKDSIEQGAGHFGGLDILINNSGMVDVKALHLYDSDRWDMVMSTNLKSMFYSFKYAYPYLKQNKKSNIVNIGSISSFVGQAETPVYTTSKHAVLGLTRSIALDYAKYGIYCNCICPGITDTPMLWEHIDNDRNGLERFNQRLKRVPLGKALRPLDVAKSVLFLSCDDSSGITGTSLTIDAGYLTAAEWENKVEHKENPTRDSKLPSVV